MSLRSCAGTNAEGASCGALPHLVGADGYCIAHRPGGAERMRELSAKGGESTARAWQSEGFKLDELPEMTTLEDAKLALDAIRRAVLTRKITHAEGNAASKAVSEWVKAESSAQTARIVNELQRELDEKAREINELREQLAKRNRTLRAVS